MRALLHWPGCFFLLSVCLLLHQVFYYRFSNCGTVEFAGSDTQYANIIIDDDANKIYLGGKNFVYRLDSDLNIELSVSTRPISTDSPYEGSENNYNKILLEYKDDTLLVCGSAEYGACKLRDKTTMLVTMESGEIPAASFAMNGSTVGVVFTASSNTILYIACTFPGISITGLPDDQAYPPAIACLFPDNDFDICYNTIFGSSQIRIDEAFLTSYPIDYVEVFNAGDYIYMFNVQPETTDPGSPIHSRVLRLHGENSLFMKTTHIELPLGLNYVDPVTGDGITLSRVSGVCHSEVTGTIRTLFRLESTDAVFIVSHDEGVDGSPTQSGLWITDIASIDRRLSDTLTACLAGDMDTSYIMTYYESSSGTECVGIQGDPSVYRESGHNFYYPVAAHEDLAMYLLYAQPVDGRGYFTSVSHTTVDGKSLVYVGTSNGYLLKLHITRTYRAVYSSTVVDEQQSKVLQLKFSSLTDKLYIVTENKVVRRDVEYCGEDYVCANCFEHFIQYCGWCDVSSSCTLLSECASNWIEYYAEDNFCDGFQPSVVSMWPEIGPMSGGTLLHIVLSIDLNGIQISIVFETTKCQYVGIEGAAVICSTPASDVTDRHSLTVYVGSLQIPAELYFNYTVDPTITSLSRLKSFLSGGLDVYVEGENLDTIQKPLLQMTIQMSDDTRVRRRDTTHIANDTTVYSICRDMESTSMTCPTPNLESLISDSDGILHVAYSFILDNVNTYLNDVSSAFGEFIIVPDPVYESLGRFEVSGSEFITIKGENLSLACNESDIVITIGDNMTCNIAALSNTHITCWMDIEAMEEGDSATIYVRTGNIVTNAGTVVIYNYPIIIIASVTAPLILIGLIIAIVVLVVVGRRKSWWCKGKNRSYNTTVKMSTLSRSSEEINFIDGGATGGQPRPLGAIDQNMSRSVDNVYNNDLISMISQGTRDQLLDVLIPFDNITLQDNIGKGNFGRVDKAVLTTRAGNTETVAVKSLLLEYWNISALESFLEEGLIMKDFDHPNVMKLLGISIDHKNCPHVILPLMTNGDLHTYISNPETLLTIRQLIDFLSQIACGMEYLSMHRFVHRDLAARNCMIDDKLAVRVSDFGMTKDVYSDSFYVSANIGKVPIKWMAPESIEHKKYDQATDVWSFGVLIWELFTRGTEPYPGISSWDVLNYLKQGRRLEAPQYSFDILNDIMFSCWWTSTERPTFTQLLEQLNNIIEDANNARRGETESIYIRYVQHGL